MLRINNLSKSTKCRRVIDEINVIEQLIKNDSYPRFLLTSINPELEINIYFSDNTNEINCFQSEPSTSFST